MTSPTTISKGQQVAADISALLRARNPLLWIVTKEEPRVERFIVEAASQAGYVPRFWDCDLGGLALDGNPIDGSDTDPGEMLKEIRKRTEKPERNVWVMRDLGPWLVGPTGVKQLRQLRNLARLLPGIGRESAQAIIVLSPSSSLPPELEGHATVVEFPLPDRSEIADILDGAIGALPEFDAEGQPLRNAAASNGTREAAIDAAVGLSAEEAAACYARSLVTSRTIDPALVANEKRRIIARERVLEWFDPIPGGLEAVGGLENLKEWLVVRENAYSPQAREYGLPAPKGALFVGVSGCGKSLLAKATATAWGVPLLKVDLGALKSKFVGESEGNLRKAFKVIEAIGRCVVWFDEIEKALQGATSGSSDGGVSSDALGAVLTWMQERQGEAFVIATANDVSGLPPELLRKGRFDEIWYVDVPNPQERKSVLSAALKSYGRGGVKIDLAKVSAACEDFTGAEIAAIVPDALFAAFADNAREIETRDLVAAAGTVVPLTKTAVEKITDLRTWAKGRARPASRELAASAKKGPAVRTVDL